MVLRIQLGSALCSVVCLQLGSVKHHGPNITFCALQILRAPVSSFCVKFWQQGSEGRGERFKQSKESLDEDSECQLLLLSAAAPLSLLPHSVFCEPLFGWSSWESHVLSLG